MKIVSINNLKPGMVISEDVFSYHGQCLAKQNTPVTLQLIEHLKFYQIASVSIFPENHGDRNSSTMTAQRLETCLLYTSIITAFAGIHGSDKDKISRIFIRAVHAH